ncbi:hypothetical protein [Streptomyces lydicamycinicus]|uniref:hypothetical protein n=1 Tax=Streptomyces lydicamycinicus TaxID=1546107 RepID=UPI003C2FB8A6
MAATVFEPSGLAALSVIRRVAELIDPAVAAVEAHLGEQVPPLTITIAGRAGLATAQLRAAGWRRARPGAVTAYWWNTYQEHRGAYAFTSVTRTDRVLIGLNSPMLAAQPGEMWPTLVHELTHAVQFARSGRRDELRAGLDNNLRIADAPAGLRHAMDAVTAIEEAEAYSVQYALTGDSAAPEFDRAAVHRRLLAAADAWAAREPAGGARCTRL